MVPQNLNMVDVILRSVRVFEVKKNGELYDKFNRNINIICEYDPQGINMKIFTGKISHWETYFFHSPIKSILLLVKVK